MSYSGGTITFNIIDVVLLLLLILLSLQAMTSNIIDELFSAFSIVGGIFVASCFHKSLAKFFYTHVTNGVSISVLNTFSIIIVFGAFFAIGQLVSDYLKKLIGENIPKGQKEKIFTILLRFFKLYIIFSVVLYIFHTKTKILQEEKIKFSHGVIYKHLAKTGRDILNITTQSRQYYY
jgi:uncharacterized membrane protein required for colicin V production